MGIAEEAWRDRVIRERFPAEEYLAARVDLDREPARPRPARSRRRRSRRGSSRPTASSNGASRRNRASWRSRSATACPAWAPAVRRAEVEVSPGAAPDPHSRTSGRRRSGRGSSRRSTSRSWPAATSTMAIARPAPARVLVNEAFARRYLNGAKPGRPARAICRLGPGDAAAVARDRRDGPRHRHDADRSRRGALRVSRRVARPRRIRW